MRKALWLIPLLAFAHPSLAVQEGMEGVCKAFELLQQVSPPAIKVTAFIILFGSFVFAGVEFWNKQIRWTIAGIAGGILIFALLFFLAEPIAGLFGLMAGAFGC